MNYQKLDIKDSGFFIPNGRDFFDGWITDLLKKSNLESSTSIQNVYYSELSVTNVESLFSISGYTDIFYHINDSEKIIENLKSENSILIFEYSFEGFFTKQIINVIQNSVNKHGISGKYVIFSTGDMLAERHRHQKNSIQILKLLRWEDHLNDLSESDIDGNIKNFLEKNENNCNENFGKSKEKYFSSLSRVNKPYRFLASYLLYKSEIMDKALISHDKLSDHELEKIFKSVFYDTNIFNTDEELKSLRNFIQKLPLTIDYTDFSVNWVAEPFSHIHDRTLFQIVNETLVDSNDIFYSEKTFRPVFCFQPFLIYGEVGINHYLKKIGYEIYDDWFNLDFDYIEDHAERYKKLLEEVTRVCKHLDTLSREEKIEWRFKNRDKLLFNFSNLINRRFNTEMINQLVNQYV